MPEGVVREEVKGGTLPSFDRILFVTDFSSYSEVAIPFAAHLAELYHANTVFAAHIISEPEGTGAVASAEELKEEREAAEAEMRNFVAANPFGKIAVEPHVGQGSIAEVVGTLIEEKKIDLVVVGTHARSGLRKLLLGSIAQRIFNTADCPMLTISPRARRAWSAEEKLARILYATSFSEHSLRALPYALSLAKAANAELLLLNVPEAAAAEPLRDVVLREWHQRLNALIPREAQAWCKSDSAVIPGDPADVILRVAEEQNAGLIVMGAHRVEEGPFYGINVPLSTPYRVVAHAHCPVLRVRSTAASEPSPT